MRIQAWSICPRCAEARAAGSACSCAQDDERQRDGEAQRERAAPKPEERSQQRGALDGLFAALGRLFNLP